MFLDAYRTVSIFAVLSYSSRFELFRHVEIARTCSKLVADRFEAKFHYAIWSQTGPKLVAYMSQIC